MMFRESEQRVCSGHGNHYGLLAEYSTTHFTETGKIVFRETWHKRGVCVCVGKRGEVRDSFFQTARPPNI